jgi:ribosomal protein S18 acetylase RimI-like enzyme
MNVIQMQPMDSNEVKDVFMAAFNAAGEHWSDEAAMEHVRENYGGDAHWVVREEGKIVGFLMAVFAARENGKELFVDAVAVLPEKQKRGIGKVLWEKAVLYAEEKNQGGIRLVANPNFQSYGWYVAMGFEPSGWVELSKRL